MIVNARQPMLALTVRQPWAWALVHGRKPIENRTWMTFHRGRLWIHASGKAPDPEGIAWLRATLPHVSIPNTYAVGAIVGFVNLTDCLVASDSVWAKPGHYAWTVTGGVALRAPVRMRGRQGIWTIDPDAF